MTVLGFIPNNSAKARSLGIEEEVSPSLRTRGLTAVAIGNNPHTLSGGKPDSSDEHRGVAMEKFIKEEIIEQTLIRSYGISLTDDNGDPYTSRVGGKFLWPKNRPFPEQMLFLAQINLEELTNNNALPEKGLLQFFIKDDEYMGLNGGQMVILHDISDKFDICEMFVDNTPILKPAVMKISAYMEAMSYSDYRFPSDDEEIYDIEEFQGWGTKILGYPFFTQYDPREYDEKKRKYDKLLFQLDSEDDFVMWGDSGTGNFFINGEALKKGDFSDVLFNWDCY